jgi:hypothetical protein
MAIGSQAPPLHGYRQPSVSGAIWHPAGTFGRKQFHAYVSNPPESALLERSGHIFMTMAKVHLLLDSLDMYANDNVYEEEEMLTNIHNHDIP